MKQLLSLYSSVLLITLTACGLTIPYESISGVEPITPTNLLLGHDVGDFWTIPAQGNANVLVVPIEFSGVPFDNSNVVVNQIDQAFNGNNLTQGHSLKGFYQQSSFGKLNIEGVVTEPFRTQYSASYYENLTSVDPNTVIIDELMSFLDDTYDFNDFDLNGDQQLDGLYMIYNHPSGDWNSFFWAYLYSYFGSQSADGVTPSSYVWMPYEFLFYNNQIDTSTLIHETGHKLGLEDYYDYAIDDGSNNEWGLGGADMMDASVGDHNPFSKLLLGWIEPKVVTEGMDVSLQPYITSGDALIITNHWNGTLFDEYLIAMYYTPTGLYEGLEDYFFDGQSGLILYHVDARLGPNQSENYPTYFLNNNTDSTHKLIKFIEADGNNSLYLKTPKGWMWASDVYQTGDIFGSTLNVGYQWNQGNRGTIPFTIRVNQEAMDETQLSISIRF